MINLAKKYLKWTTIKSQLDWNKINNNTKAYLLTLFKIEESDKIDLLLSILQANRWFDQSLTKFLIVDDKQAITDILIITLTDYLRDTIYMTNLISNDFTKLYQNIVQENIVETGDLFNFLYNDLPENDVPENVARYLNSANQQKNNRNKQSNNSAPLIQYINDLQQLINDNRNQLNNFINDFFINILLPGQLKADHHVPRIWQFGY